MKNEYDMLNGADMDLSVYEEAELSEREKRAMKNVIKRKINYKKTAVLAACIMTAAVLSQTAFAQDLFGRIVRSISTGHNTFTQIDMTGAEAPMAEQFAGLVFNEDGSPATTYKDGAKYFDVNGREITDWGEFVKENADKMSEEIQIELASKDKDPLENWRDTGWRVVTNPEEINAGLTYEAKLPEYLPDGYRFYGAATAKDSKYYLFAYYINDKGEYFSVDERIINEETAFEAGSDSKVTETTINGCKAAIVGGKSVNWEQDGIAISVNSFGAFDEAELLKIAESIR